MLLWRTEQHLGGKVVVEREALSISELPGRNGTKHPDRGRSGSNLESLDSLVTTRQVLRTSDGPRSRPHDLGYHL